MLGSAMLESAERNPSMQVLCDMIYAPLFRGAEALDIGWLFDVLKTHVGFAGPSADCWLHEQQCGGTIHVDRLGESRDCSSSSELRYGGHSAKPIENSSLAVAHPAAGKPGGRRGGRD